MKPDEIPTSRRLRAFAFLPVTILMAGIAFTLSGCNNASTSETAAPSPSPGAAPATTPATTAGGAVPNRAITPQEQRYLNRYGRDQSGSKAP